MKIITSWDDAGKKDLKIADLLSKYNLPGIFYWQTSLDKGKNLGRMTEWLTLEDCKEIAQKFEVGSHTSSHSWLSKISVKQANDEIRDSRKFWQDHTGQPINSFCYPRNKHNVIIRKIVENVGYSEGRTTIVGNISATHLDKFQKHTTVHAIINRIEYKGLNWETYARKMLEEARKNEDSEFHLFGHSWEAELFNGWDSLENIFKAMANK